MAKYWHTTHHHDYPWETVASAYWRRYPNPKSRHVYSEDFLECRVLDDGRLYTKRLLTKTNKIPHWARRLPFLPAADHVPMVEEAICDPTRRTLTTYARNVGLRYVMDATERVVFSASSSSSSSSSRTSARKEVWVESDLFGVHELVKKLALDRYKRNCRRATKGFEWVLGGAGKTAPSPTSTSSSTSAAVGSNPFSGSTLTYPGRTDSTSDNGRVVKRQTSG